MQRSRQTYFYRAACLILICFFSSTVFAQTISSSVDRKDILIGQQISFRLNIVLPSSAYKVDLVLPDTIPHFEIIALTGGDTTDKDGNSIWQRKIRFTSFDSGKWTFPPFPYRIVKENTASQPLYTDSFSVNVGYMPIDQGGNPRDIKNVLDVTILDWFWISAGAGVLAFLILVYLIWMYLHFRKKKKKVDPYQGSQSAYEEAQTALAEMRRKNNERSMPVKEFYTALSEIFKRYYARSSGQEFSNRTSGDILLKLKEYALNAEASANAAKALGTMDAVKFAKYNPTYIENESALDYVSATITEMENLNTKPETTN